MSANIEQIKAMLERAGKTNLLQKQKVDLDKERRQLEATVNIEKIDKSLEEAVEDEFDDQFYKFLDNKDKEHTTWSEDDLLELAKHFFDFGKQTGASWMAGQGVNGYVVESFNPATESGKPNLHGITILYEDNDDNYVVAGDKVIVQIRRKDE